MRFSRQQYRSAAIILSLAFCQIAISDAYAKDETQEARGPNIVFILADDLGYRELGAFGQTKIKTPVLDRLAEQGMRLTHHYSGSPVCAPARCTLMTGKHGGHAWIRDNANPPGAVNKPNELLFPGQMPIPAEEVTLGELFQRAGYKTAAIGKWGLGQTGNSGDPNKQGFDLFFGYQCQVHAHNHYPRFLWKNDEKILYPGNNRGATGETYSQDEFVRVALQFIDENRDRPFFLYLPFAVPHLSIQVPDEDVEPYQESIEEADYQHRGYLPHPAPRAGYAAMITRMDRGIGQILDRLENHGIRENTIVIFTSDNGPTYNRLGGSDSEYFQSAGGFRGLKGEIYEGGIRVPCIVNWPGHVPAETTSEIPSYFPDWLPTLLDLAGKKDLIPDDINGISIAPTLAGHPDLQPKRDYLMWEFRGYGGQQAVRLGNWKGVRRNILRGNRTLELYDLDTDPAESKDVAADHPDIVTRIETILETDREPSAIFPMPWDKDSP